MYLCMARITYNACIASYIGITISRCSLHTPVLHQGRRRGSLRAGTSAVHQEP